MNTKSEICVVLEKLAAFRTELVDRAFELERHGRLDAADEAMTSFARIGELCEELAPGGLATNHGATGFADGSSSF